MKLLHYTGVYSPAWKWGGPPRSTANMCEGLAAAGHDVTVFTTDAGLENNRELPRNCPVLRNGVTVHYFEADHSYSGIRSTLLEKAVTTHIKDFDLLHVTGVWQPTSVAACRSAEKAGIPYVVSPRGALGRYSFTRKPWKKWPYWWLRERQNCSRAAAVHYTSAMEMEECARFRFPSRAFVVPNGIDFTEWWRDEEAGRLWRGELGVEPSSQVFLYAGRLHHKKGLDLLPPVLAALREQNWKMVFMGDDEDGTGKRLEEAFRLLNMVGRVVFLPMSGSTDLRAAYSGADLFLFPSRHENFGNVAIEAAACGCQVIISDQVGSMDQFVDTPGVLVLPREAVVWSSAISSMSSTCEPPKREFLVGTFSVESVSRRMEDLYSQLIRS